MNVSGRPTISFVIATHNRCAVVESTLKRVRALRQEVPSSEIIVVDNASTDHTRTRVAPLVDVLICLRRNIGSCSKALGVDRAGGKYIVFLDDDAYPKLGSLVRMIDHFESDDGLAAAGFRVHLPSGCEEASALPGVFVGCGVGLRTDALRSVGGLDRSFFMQAEEYDLCFKLSAAGWKTEVFDDLHVEHMKTELARKSQRTTFYDIRNNLRVAARFLPSSYYEIYRQDWCQRYAWLAMNDGHYAAYDRGIRVGRPLAARERVMYRRKRLHAISFERFFLWSEINERFRQLGNDGVRRVLLADLGKNIYAFYQAARRHCVQIVAIADDRFHRPGRRYRGLDILPVTQSLGIDVDRIVVSQTTAPPALASKKRLEALTSTPVVCWFGSNDKTLKIDNAYPVQTAPINSDVESVLGQKPRAREGLVSFVKV